MAVCRTYLEKEHTLKKRVDEEFELKVSFEQLQIER